MQRRVEQRVQWLLLLLQSYGRKLTLVFPAERTSCRLVFFGESPMCSTTHCSNCKKRKGRYGGKTINIKPSCHVLNNKRISVLTFSSVPPKSALYHLNIWLSRTSFFPESTTQASSFSKKASAAVRSWLSISWWSRFNIYSLNRCIFITESLWADVSQGLFRLPLEYRFWLVGSPLPHSSGQNEWEAQRPAAPPNGQYSTVNYNTVNSVWGSKLVKCRTVFWQNDPILVAADLFWRKVCGAVLCLFYSLSGHRFRCPAVWRLLLQSGSSHNWRTKKKAEREMWC